MALLTLNVYMHGLQALTSVYYGRHLSFGKAQIKDTINQFNLYLAAIGLLCIMVVKI